MTDLFTFEAEEMRVPVDFIKEVLVLDQTPAKPGSVEKNHPASVEIHKFSGDHGLFCLEEVSASMYIGYKTEHGRGDESEPSGRVYSNQLLNVIQNFYLTNIMHSVAAEVPNVVFRDAFFLAQCLPFKEGPTAMAADETISS